MCIGALSCIARITAMSQCSVKVPVPDISFCDATGALEEKVDANIYETSGRVKAVQDFQYDAFELFNHQLTTLLDDSTSTDMNIHDVEEEILTLKRFVSRVLSDSVNDEIPEISGTRHKRAASVNQTQQLLNSAKATFQQELAKITNKLAIISSSIAKEAAQTTAIHTKLLNELTSNQLTLTTTEQQLNALDTTIRNVLKTTKPGVGGVSLSAVRQQITDLVINASVAEQITQRQLDNIEKLEQQMERSEQAAAAKLTSLETDLSNLDNRLPNITHQIANLKGGERIYEDKIGTFIYNTTHDVADLTAKQATLQQEVTKAGQDAFSATMKLGAYEQNLTQFRHNVDGIQSIVTFIQPIQQAQSGQILQLKKTLADNIHVMQYAFGVRSTPP